MQETQTVLTDSCSFSGIQPAIASLPYPPVAVSAKNPAYASLLRDRKSVV